MITISQRFNGPPDSGNGGYAAGLIAGAIGTDVIVRLMQPLPIDKDLTIAPCDAERWDVRDGAELIATAKISTPQAEVPVSPSYIEALGASKHYAGFAQHAYPTCFVCGPARSRGDGLRIFPGSVPGTGVVAAPWLPDISLDDGSGKVRPEFVWAALDCPGYFGCDLNPRQALLGELSVHIDRLVHIDEPCVVIGWQIAVDGRKHRAGTALFDEEGELCALGVATWIQVGASA
jgi:hypothetical protein